jgi:hypothetical protein
MAEKREEGEFVKGREVSWEEAEGERIRRVGCATEEVVRGGFMRREGIVINFIRD